MTSATGKHASQSSAAIVGFTLIEIVLVLGLMAFAAAAVITNFTSMAERGDSQTSTEILQAAVRKARFIAASERVVIEMGFNKETGSLYVSGANGSRETFPLNEDFNSTGPAEINFYLVPSGTGLAPLAEASRTSLKTNTVKFAPDRSSSPFVVDIDGGRGTPDRLVFDPFSSLLITEKK